ncbi:hypothetical protein AYI70_g129 [Smittium culicis]|uniref:Uncharacterized protein n=1 Tax=Smittium culicis TaxID=133412 RepID=A0A1R1YI70_9FUNG|nr:hypothetical protein AYI70_g129 [Smittium culicis]
MYPLGHIFKEAGERIPKLEAFYYTQPGEQIMPAPGKIQAVSNNVAKYPKISTERRKEGKRSTLLKN